MSKGKLINVVGNITEPQKTTDSEIVIIPHIVNTLGIMGAGVALGLKNKWKEVYDSYKYSLTVYYNKGNSLGTISIADVEDDIFVFNMVAQNGLKSINNPKPIKYLALIKCMEEVVISIEIMKTKIPYKDKKFVIHSPKFGNLRAGGNFSFILELIEEIWIDKGYDVVIYEYRE